MKLQNFNWNEQAIDRVVTEDGRYTTYTGYASHEFDVEVEIEEQLMNHLQPQEEQLTTL